MIHTTIELKPDYTKAGISHSDCVAKLTTYIVDHHSEYRGDKKRPLVLICPGGGYTHLSFREAEPIAIRMNSYGESVPGIFSGEASLLLPCLPPF